MWSNFCFKMKILFDGKLVVLFFVYFRNFKVAIFLALAQCSLFFTISWIWKILDQYLNSRKIQVCLISGEDDSFLSVALNSSKSIILINTLSYCLYLLFMTINFSPPISFYEYLLNFWENKVLLNKTFRCTQVINLLLDVGNFVHQKYYQNETFIWQRFDC